MNHPLIAALILCGALARPGGAAGRPEADDPAIVRAEFVFDAAPFPSSHASTIAETADGLIAAWFGGRRERSPDVTIWISRHRRGRWTDPESVADGVRADGGRFPTWNPVLYAAPSGPLFLFYKVGPSPSGWWGEWKTSDDQGETWSAAHRLPEGILGPIKNKPVRLDSGVLLCPSSVETDPGDRWSVHIERTADLGKTWEKTASLGGTESLGIIQPTLLVHKDGRLQALCRSRQGRIYTSRSDDRGRTWSEPSPTTLPNPNSGIDAVTLADGRFLLIYNHTERGRSPLNVAISDDGQSWKAGPVLESEPGEYSYPAVIQSKDGLVHVTYTYQRRKIRHVVLDPAKIVPRDWP